MLASRTIGKDDEKLGERRGLCLPFSSPDTARWMGDSSCGFSLVFGSKERGVNEVKWLPNLFFAVCIWMVRGLRSRSHDPFVMRCRNLV